MKAFPEIKYVAPQGMGSHVMAIEGGMDLRDYFAAKAMQGMLSNAAFDTIEGMMNVSVVAYMMADAMMKARELK